MPYEHKTVLVGEVLEFWHAKAGGNFVDATVGLGGHSKALLESDPSAVVLGLDIDPEALAIARERLEKFKQRVFLIKEGYMNLGQAMEKAGFSRADGILVDLGVSSMQLDMPERGFSFQKEGPLDMRMDPTSGETALEFIRRCTTEELARTLKTYGDERLAWPIAKRLKDAAERGALNTTLECAEIANAVYGGRQGAKTHPATRTFQALRIAVNGELGSLDNFLKSAPGLLTKGGRLVCISFHSLEDRRVKEAFRKLSTSCVCPNDFPICVCGKTAEFKTLTKKPVIAEENESLKNPRSRSAKMRVLEKI